VDEGGGLQGVPDALPKHEVLGDFVQLVVHEGQKLVGGYSVAAPHPLQVMRRCRFGFVHRRSMTDPGGCGIPRVESRPRSAEIPTGTYYRI